MLYSWAWGLVSEWVMYRLRKGEEEPSRLVTRFGVKLDEPFNATAANGAEGGGFVCFHATVGRGAIYAFRLIACAFINADGFGVKR